jgi:hypothetical protein
MSQRFKYGGANADDPRACARPERAIGVGGLAFFHAGPGKATLSGCQRDRAPKTTETP